jgi:hypothetical protein
MARVDGKPKMISERHLGTAADIAAAIDARNAAKRPDRTSHLAFGDVSAVSGAEKTRCHRDHRRGDRRQGPGQ